MTIHSFSSSISRSTVYVTGTGASVNNAWEQCKPKARKLQENPHRPGHALLTTVLIE